jgi:nucleotide-binding universal stress UspA family protein
MIRFAFVAHIQVELILLRSIGKTVDMINRAVEQFHIDEIVLGKGGSTFLAKTFLGSITKAVMV